MSGDDYVSPRAAIRNWLEDAAPKPRLTTNHELSKRPERHSRSKKHTREIDVGNPKRPTSPGIDQHPPYRARHMNGHSKTKENHVDRNALPGQQNFLEPGGSNLAERLGLHAPFRKFGEQNVDEEADLGALSRPRKRRRRKSSTDSYLEAAEIEDAAEHARGAVRSIDMPRSRRQEREDIKTDAPYSPEILEKSGLAGPSPKKTTKSYERRPRHKTREDRYDLKEPNKSRNEKDSNKKNGAEKKTKPRRRKKKSGAALMHDFTAQNVSHDRLTLQPSKSLGVFRKGKASSPVRRQGLPDLAFSELKFLSSRRAKPDEVVEAPSKHTLRWSKRRKSIKAADNEAEISRFFTATKVADPIAKDHDHQRMQRNVPTNPPNHETPPVIIDLPNTSFLGFGSCGANSVSPVKRIDSPAMRDLEQKLTRSLTRSTSYLTWSQSGAPSPRSSNSRNPKSMPLVSSRVSDHNAQSSTLHESKSPIPRAPLPYSDKISRSKQSVTRTLAPRENTAVKSPNGTSRSRQRKVRQTNKEEPSDKSKKTKKVRVVDGSEGPVVREDTVPEAQGAKSPDQLHNDLQPLRKDGMLGETTPCLEGTREPSEALDTENLDNTLEELLHHCRPKRTVEIVQPPGQQPTPEISGTSERVIDNHANDVNNNPSPDTNHRSHPSASSSRFPISATHWAGYSNPHTENVMRVQRPQLQGLPPTLSRHDTIPTPRPPPNIKSEQARFAENSRGDSRSAWTGYEALYERQQDLDSPCFPNGEDYAPNGRYANTNDFHDFEIEQYHPEFYDEMLDHGNSPQDDRLEYSPYNFDPEQSFWPYEDTDPEHQARDTHKGWYPVDGSLLAAHERHYPRGNLSHADRLGLQDDVVLNTPEPYFEPANQKYGFTNFVPLQEIHGSNRSWHDLDANGAEDSTEDPALSKFWTPHRLY